jgi:hypothetical protein
MCVFKQLNFIKLSFFLQNTPLVSQCAYPTLLSFTTRIWESCLVAIRLQLHCRDINISSNSLNIRFAFVLFLHLKTMPNTTLQSLWHVTEEGYILFTFRALSGDRNLFLCNSMFSKRIWPLNPNLKHQWNIGSFWFLYPTWWGMSHEGNYLQE